VPLAQIRDLLGHSTIKVTERYAHRAPENTRGAVEVLASRRRERAPFLVFFPIWCAGGLHGTSGDLVGPRVGQIRLVTLRKRFARSSAAKVRRAGAATLSFTTEMDLESEPYPEQANQRWTIRDSASPLIPPNAVVGPAYAVCVSA